MEIGQRVQMMKRWRHKHIERCIMAPQTPLFFFKKKKKTKGKCWLQITQKHGVMLLVRIQLGTDEICTLKSKLIIRKLATPIQCQEKNLLLCLVLTEKHRRGRSWRGGREERVHPLTFPWHQPWNFHYMKRALSTVLLKQVSSMPVGR
jgi:hypothetical protein